MLKTIISLAFIQLIGVVINTARTKIFALLLGPAGYGVVATIDQLVTSVSQFANLSIPFTALKFLSYCHSIGEESYRKSYSAFLKIILLLALLATLIAVLILPVLLESLDPQLAKYQQPVLIALFGVPATMLLVYFIHMFASRQQTFRSISLSVVSVAVLALFGSIGCVLAGIPGIYLATIPASTFLIIGIVIYAQVKMKLPFHYGSLLDWKGSNVLTGIVQTAAFTYLAVSVYSAMLLLARYEAITALGEEATGYLQAMLAVALSLGAALTPSNTLYFTPYVNRAIPATEKIAAAHRFLPRLMFLYALGALPVLLFPELTLRILFSNRFIEAATVLPAFVIWQCLFQAASIYQQLLMGLDDVRGFAALTITGNIIVIGCCLWITKLYGLAGIAVAFILGSVTILILVAFRLYAKYAMTIPKSVYMQFGAIILGFCGIAMLDRVTLELTLQGIGARFITASLFLAGLWVVLPKALRTELTQGLTTRMRLLKRRTSP